MAAQDCRFTSEINEYVLTQRYGCAAGDVISSHSSSHHTAGVLRIPIQCSHKTFSNRSTIGPKQQEAFSNTLVTCQKDVDHLC